MCLAIPGEVKSLETSIPRMGIVDFGGVQKRICLEYVPDVKCGDYVLVHVGFAISKVDKEEAKRTLEMIQEIRELDDNAVS